MGKKSKLEIFQTKEVFIYDIIIGKLTKKKGGCGSRLLKQNFGVVLQMGSTSNWKVFKR